MFAGNTMMKELCTLRTLAYLGEHSQNLLSKFVRFYVALGLKIMRVLRLKVDFEAEK